MSYGVFRINGRSSRGIVLVADCIEEMLFLSDESDLYETLLFTELVRFKDFQESPIVPLCDLNPIENVHMNEPLTISMQDYSKTKVSVSDSVEVIIETN